MIRNDLRDNLKQKLLDSSNEKKELKKCKEELDSFVRETYISELDEDLMYLFKKYGKDSFNAINSIKIHGDFLYGETSILNNIDRLNNSLENILWVNLLDIYPRWNNSSSKLIKDECTKQKTTELLNNLYRALVRYQELEKEITELLGVSYLSTEILKKHLPQLL